MESVGFTKLRRQKLELMQQGSLGQHARETGTEGRECRTVQKSPPECPAGPYTDQGEVLNTGKSTGKQSPKHLWSAHVQRETSPAGHSVASSGGCCLSREAKFTLDYKSALDLPLEKLKSKPEMYETDPESFKCIPE